MPNTPANVSGSRGLIPNWYVTIGEVKEAPHRTVTRRSDEPKLEIGDKIPMGEGLVGVVLARYTRAGDVSGDVHYIVELRREH